MNPANWKLEAKFLFQSFVNFLSVVFNKSLNVLGVNELNSVIEIVDKVNLV